MFEGYLSGTAEMLDPEDIPRTCTEPVYVLGKKYSMDEDGTLEQIRSDVRSRLWCTYRRNLTPIGSPQLTTDKGWGCMLRCGQMILGQSLVELHLGRQWRWTPETRDFKYLKIVNMFGDDKRNPFSLHQIALMGNDEDKKVGQWFGPNTIAQVLKKLIKFEEWCNLIIHVALDNVVITEDVIEVCTDGGTKDFKPLLLLVPLRLGISEINPIYFNGLKRFFQIPGCMGMIGGRPNQALYFVGYVGDDALHLDPHTTQNSGCAVGQKLSDEEIEMDATFHQKYAMRIDFRQMDPSVAVGFLCRTRPEFDQLCTRLSTDLVADGIQPLFEISKQRLAPWQSAGTGRATSGDGSYCERGDDETESKSNNTQYQLDFEDVDIRHNSDDEFEFIA